MTEPARPIGPPVDASPAQEPSPVTLTGRFGAVTRFSAARDGAALWPAIGAHAALWTYIPNAGPFAGPGEFPAWAAAREKSTDPYFYTVLDLGGRALGVLGLMSIRPEMRVIEAANIVYGPDLQRTPLATETQYLLARYVFETLSYRRYEWKCAALNAPSRGAALRYGFVFEAVFRQHMIVKARSRDTAWFSMLDSEWSARKRNFECWLDPANFDSAGQQKTSLAAL